MNVIFAQGNPEKVHDETRHNVGFAVLDILAGMYGTSFVSRSRFKADVAEIGSGEDRILLVKPATFYNETGVSAHSLVDFYKLNPRENLLVIHDDLALPFGTIRIRRKGSDAGNNGIKSLNAHIGPDYIRIRIGIYNELRDRTDDADFVLSRFTGDERTALRSTIIPKVIELTQAFLAGTLEDTSHALL
jgi:PTH1 family peptidyl-tRNA hydrolase